MALAGLSENWHSLAAEPRHLLASEPLRRQRQEQ
jgi:hypothetical protein